MFSTVAATKFRKASRPCALYRRSYSTTVGIPILVVLKRKVPDKQQSGSTCLYPDANGENRTVKKRLSGDRNWTGRSEASAPRSDGADRRKRMVDEHDAHERSRPMALQGRSGIDRQQTRTKLVRALFTFARRRRERETQTHRTVFLLTSRCFRRPRSPLPSNKRLFRWPGKPRGPRRSPEFRTS